MNELIGNLSTHLQSAPVAALFLDALVKSVVVLALAGAVCVLWRQASAGTRHLIWFLAVASLPLLPLANLTRPGWQKPAWAISTESGSGNQISLALELAPGAVVPAPLDRSDATKVFPASVSAGASHKVATHFNANWVPLGWYAWLAGAMVVLARLGAGQFHRRKFSRFAQPVPETDWARLLNDACETLHLRRSVTLLQSANQVMPMTWGWWRPVVLLPAEASQWPEARRRVVLLHELAHVKRGDYLTQTVAQLVCALYWFNPLVWVAARQMRVEREGACDDLVLAGGCKASDYAGHLVEIAGSFRRVPQMAAIAMARSSQLEGRIAAIVDASRNRRLRAVAALAILALIGGIALCLGGSSISSAGGAEKSGALREQQIEQLKAFSVEKLKQSQILAAAAGETISPEFQHFFDAATSSDWQTVTNLFESFKQRHPQYSHEHQIADLSLRTSYWGPVLEICLAYDAVTLCEPAYTQMAVDDIINSIPPGSIYFGGTDPGRGLPTAFCKSQVDADPFYTLTQNALADGTYLDYLQRTYGNQRGLLGQMAAKESKEIKMLKSELAATQLEIAEAQKDSDSGRREAEVSDLERKAKLQRGNAEYFENTLEQAEQEIPPPAGTLYIPTAEDSQHCFEDYIQDAKKRLETHQLKPDENIKVDAKTGRVDISGQVAVMQINGLLAKLIFDKNPGHEIFIEESFPLDWMYPYLEPHGLIMKINREPLSELSDAMIQQDRDFWQPRVTQMIGDWLNDKTSVKSVTAFGEKVFLRHDLGGFSGDPRFVENDYASKTFSKLRSSIAGLYAWRAENATVPGEKERMARAADFAFRQSLALCADSPEAATRYADFLKQQHREADAGLVQALADDFKPTTGGSAALSKASVFQIRLALDAPTDNTEPMRLTSQNGSSENVETPYVAKEILLDHTAVQAATFDTSKQGYPEIGITLTDTGRKRFAEITRQHLHQRLAMVIDGKLWMAPVVQTEITGGKAVVTGGFSDDEAKDLTAKINDAAGK